MGHPHGLPVDPDAGRRIDARVLAAIAAGGALGAPARYAVSRIVHVAPNTFPWATFWTNVSGSFLLGLLVTVIVERVRPTKYLRPFAAVGFLGAYTTFSTFAVETDVLVKDGHTGIAVVYVVASIVAGVAAATAGIAAGAKR